ncbi:MAG TPA: hypothetical protein VFV40_04970 [Nocardioides sp.]|nr:hypothetical protein [Nocardioides sp.]
MSHLGKTGRRALAAAVATFMMLAVAVAVPSSAGAAGQGADRGPSKVLAAGQGVFKSEVVRGVADDGRKVRATVTPTQFTTDEHGALFADVLVRGVATGKGGRSVDTQVIQDVPVQVNAVDMASGGPGMAGTAAGACDILNLVLGPLDLDLLGLQVHLDQVVLDIVAQSGAGNLLGNLLCAVAGLLDPASPLDVLLGQLNDLLDQLLGGLLGGLSA